MSSLPYRTRERPMRDSERVAAVEWGGIRVVEGTRIAYDVTVYGHSGQEGVARHEGIVAELHLDHWWGSPTPIPYAEVDEDDGTEERVFFRRDHVSTEVGYPDRAVVDGALF